MKWNYHISLQFFNVIHHSDGPNLSMDFTTRSKVYFVQKKKVALYLCFYGKKLDNVNTTLAKTSLSYVFIGICHVV